MDEQTYLKKRVDDQIDWFSKKSTHNQNRYKTIRVVVIALSVIIPLASGYMSGNDYAFYIKLAVGIAGVVIALLEGIETMNKYQENWVNYRTTAEALQRERNLFLTKTGTYQEAGENAFNEFVLRVESMLSDENNKWVRYIQTKNKNKA